MVVGVSVDSETFVVTLLLAQSTRGAQRGRVYIYLSVRRSHHVRREGLEILT